MLRKTVIRYWTVYNKTDTQSDHFTNEIDKNQRTPGGQLNGVICNREISSGLIVVATADRHEAMRSNFLIRE